MECQGILLCCGLGMGMLMLQHIWIVLNSHGWILMNIHENWLCMKMSVILGYIYIFPQVLHCVAISCSESTELKASCSGQRPKLLPLTPSVRHTLWNRKSMSKQWECPALTFWCGWISSNHFNKLEGFWMASKRIVLNCHRRNEPPQSHWNRSAQNWEQMKICEKNKTTKTLKQI